MSDPFPLNAQNAAKCDKSYVSAVPNPAVSFLKIFANYFTRNHIPQQCSLPPLSRKPNKFSSVVIQAKYFLY